MTDRLTDAELEHFGEGYLGWPDIHRVVAELRELRERYQVMIEEAERYERLYEELRAENAKLRAALEAITRRVPIMGSVDEYRRGQLDALEACRGVAETALASVKGETP
jgi:hypothetical protein